VHLNLPFPEPLLPTGAPLLDVPATVESPTARAVATVAVDLDESVARIGANRRGLVVAGFGAATDLDRATGFAEAAGWPLLADPISQLRGPGTISTYEALVRASAFAATHRPDLVVRVGAPLTSKAANAWLADVPHILIDADGIWRDPDRTAALRLHADPNTVLAALSDALALTASVWRDDWSAAEERVRAAIDAELDAEDTPCEARIARDIARATKDTLVVASSLPVRALEWTMAPRADLRVLANRGANGIDGFVSTALGIARATRSQVTALCGDLCFLHDIGALATADANTRVRFVVIDNGGGGIFSYLPQHDLPRDEFERLFLTPARVDIAAVAQAYQRGAVEVEVLTVDGEKSRVRHARMWEAAASAFS
jgi:2-succinyl-5-enolpyruvyl-6-hydroxy-3-cyclohexene-1-carboxylate synthase